MTLLDAAKAVFPMIRSLRDGTYARSSRFTVTTVRDACEALEAAIAAAQPEQDELAKLKVVVADLIVEGGSAVRVIYGNFTTPDNHCTANRLRMALEVAERAIPFDEREKIRKEEAKAVQAEQVRTGTEIAKTVLSRANRQDVAP
jgi:hypothetical protein